MPLVWPKMKKKNPLVNLEFAANRFILNALKFLGVWMNWSCLWCKYIVYVLYMYCVLRMLWIKYFSQNALRICVWFECSWIFSLKTWKFPEPYYWLLSVVGTTCFQCIRAQSTISSSNLCIHRCNYAHTAYEHQWIWILNSVYAILRVMQA